MVLNHPNLITATSLRPMNMSLAHGDTRDSLSNRRDFLEGLGIDYRDLVCARQAHLSHVQYISASDKGRGALSEEDAFCNTDALITDNRRLPLAVFTADCLPVFLYDPKNQGIGLVHAGWKGTKEKILTKTVLLMQELFSTRTKDLLVGFGPSIRQCCYAVGREFFDFFSYGLTSRDGQLYLDLVGINKKEALDLGVDKTNIFDSSVCTYCNPKEFFSFRREGPSCGRMMSVIMLK